MPAKKPEEKKEKKSAKRLVLLDSHAIIHRAYHALPDFSSSKGEPTGAIYGLATMLIRIASDLKPDYVVACYDLPGKTFRHETYDAYKAGRSKADEALVAQLIRSRDLFKAFNIPIYDCPGFEADDMLGTIVAQESPKGTDIVIASGDMDTLQLVDDKKVQVFTLKKGLNDVVLYDEEAVKTRYGFPPKLLPDYKGLRGDPSDNIIGIKGIGEKTATTLITTFGTIENIYKALKKKDPRFSEIGITPRVLGLLTEGEEEALFSKTLATIRHDAPIKFTLPEKHFLESIDATVTSAFFAEMEFRSLGPRLASLLNKGGIPQAKIPQSVQEKSPELEDVDPLALQEAAIKTWLLNSDLTNPGLADILGYTRAKNFTEAREIIERKLKEEKLEKVWSEIEGPIMPIVNEMEKTGVLIDKKFFKKLSGDYTKKLDALVKKIHVHAGVEFNINSPKQLSEVLFDKLGLATKRKRGESGSYSTKIEVLEELEELHPIIKEIMAYRELQKLLSTYIDVIPEIVGDDGRLHPKFIQNGSTTGRFSAQNPNLQNIPIRTEQGRAIRDGFLAAQGSKLVALDYSQIELRVVAMLSGDKKLIDTFKQGKDIHASVASYIFKVPEDKVDREMRRKAKVVNFGILYGMGVMALKKNLESTREEAQAYYNAYFDQFTGVRDYLENTKEEARKTGCTETLFGRKRRFEAIKSKLPYLRSMAERMATNAPLQGTAADIIKLAIRYADEDLRAAKLGEKAKLILQIHDELVYEIKDDVVESATKIILNAMQTVLERSFIHYKTDVPLIANTKCGDTWGEAK